MGSFFSSDSQESAVVLAHHTLRNHSLVRESPAVGSSLLIAGKTHRVIGVAPRGFTGIEPEPVDAWLLMGRFQEACFPPGGTELASGGRWLRLIGRLVPGSRLPDAITELTRPELAVVPENSAGGLEAVFPNGRHGRMDRNRPILYVFGGAVLVLLVAMFNVACLLAVAIIDRRSELGIRRQLGASRWSLIRLLMAEHAVMALVSVAFAIPAASATIAILSNYLPADSDVSLLRLPVLISLLAVGITTCVGAGLLPTLAASRTRESVGRSGRTENRSGARARDTLAAVQIAIAFALASASALFARSVVNLSSDLGLDVDRLVVVSAETRGASIGATGFGRGYLALAERARDLPAVERATLSTGALLGSGSLNMAVAIRGDRAIEQGFPRLFAVGSEYFETVGTKIVAGRGFQPSDDAAREPVAVVDRHLARALWPGVDPLGRCATVGPVSCVTVVGVSEPRRDGFITTSAPQFFVPLEQQPYYPFDMAPQMLLVRTTSDADAAVSTIKAGLIGSVEQMSLLDVREMSQLVSRQTKDWRMAASLLAVFGLVSTALCAVGAYGVLTFVVRSRTVEFAVRSALGASPGVLARLVVMRAAILTGVGMAAGFVISRLADPFVEPWLFGVTATDGSIQVLTGAIVATSVFAAVVPPVLAAARSTPAAAMQRG
jgi:predicted permease